MRQVVHQSRAEPEAGTRLQHVFVLMSSHNVVAPGETMPLMMEAAGESTGELLQYKQNILANIIRSVESPQGVPTKDSHAATGPAHPFSHLAHVYLSRTQRRKSVADLNNGITELEIEAAVYCGMIGTLLHLLECPLDLSKQGAMCVTACGASRCRVLKLESLGLPGCAHATVEVLPDIAGGARSPAMPALGSLRMRSSAAAYLPKVLHSMTDPALLARRVWELWAATHHEGDIMTSPTSIAWGPRVAPAPVLAPASAAISPSLAASMQPPLQASQHPVEFSWYLCRSLVLSSHAKQKLLCAESAEVRLRECLRFLQKDQAESTGRAYLFCNSPHCRNSRQGGQNRLALCPQTHVLSVPGASGQVGSYVNPNGAVHTTVTVRDLDRRGYNLHGQPTITDSWFPGYEWTTISCRRCWEHLGWKFSLPPSEVLTRDRDTDGRISHFFGLVKDSVFALHGMAGRVISAARDSEGRSLGGSVYFEEPFQQMPASNQEENDQDEDENCEDDEEESVREEGAEHASHAIDYEEFDEDAQRRLARALMLRYLANTATFADSDDYYSAEELEEEDEEEEEEEEEEEDETEILLD